MPLYEAGAILITVAQQALLLAAPVAFGVAGALVVVLFTLGRRDFQLHEALVVEVHHERDKRHAIAFGGGPQARDLAAFDQQLAFAAFEVAKHRTLIRGDIGVGQPQLSIVDRRVAVGDVGLAAAQRFNLGPVQHDANFEVVFDRVIIPRAAVFSDNFVILVFGFLGHDPLEIGDGRRRHKA